MEDVLKQIKAVSGALGCLVYDDNGQMVSHLFPGIFDQKTLAAAVATISENLPGLKELTGGVKMIDLRFLRGRVVVKAVEGGCLVILCNGDINLQSLIISLNLAVNQVQKKLAAGISAPRQATAETKVSAPVVTESPQEMIENGALAPSLQGMQAALAKFLGPMAQVIFLESVETWLQAHQPAKSFLPHLVDIVVVEIGDPAKISDYRQKVAQFL
jgi:predicted regulator of Ras-like GTPase activity (Roadblock/LC7/MglB family)